MVPSFHGCDIIGLAAQIFDFKDQLSAVGCEVTELPQPVDGSTLEFSA